MQGLPLSLSGVRRIMDNMDWGDALEFVSFGHVNPDQLDDADFYILVAPQNVVGSPIILNLIKMVSVLLIIHKPCKSRGVAKCLEQKPFTGRYAHLNKTLWLSMLMIVRAGSGLLGCAPRHDSWSRDEGAFGVCTGRSSGAAGEDTHPVQPPAAGCRFAQWRHERAVSLRHIIQPLKPPSHHGRAPSM